MQLRLHHLTKDKTDERINQSRLTLTPQEDNEGLLSQEGGRA